MGDVLMTTPAFQAIKDSFADCRLTLLTSSAGAAVSKLIPEIDETIVFDVPWVKNDSDRDQAAVISMADELSRRAYDGAIIFNTYSQSPLPAAMLCYLAGINQVLGYCHENPYGLMSDWIPDIEPAAEPKHEVIRQLDLVRHIGAVTENTRLRLTVSDSATAIARQKLQTLGVDMSRPWLILHAGVSEDKRRYNAQHYIAAMRDLVGRGWQVVLTGSSNEKEYVSNLMSEIGAGAHDMSGVLTLEELAAAISLCNVLVSNNTGPVHIAAATGRPVVVLYAMTNPQHTPWQTPSRVLYFPVPETLRSKNYFLQDFPGTAEPQASPEAIVNAVLELAVERKD